MKADGHTRIYTPWSKSASCIILFMALALVNANCKHASEPSPNNIPDTTSHNFKWEVTTLGGGSSSILYDVAIVTDTLAYAVGVMYQRDSLGILDPNAFNMARWNGISWQLSRIPFIGSCSAVTYPPIRAIWAFSYHYLLLTNGGAVVRFDGRNSVMDCGMNPLLAGAIDRFYAIDSNNVYAVGNTGSIVHFNGSSWQKLATGTTLDFKDIYGAQNTQTGRWEVLAVASQQYQSLSRRIVRIEGLTVESVADTPVNQPLTSCWFVPGNRYFVAGSGIYEKEHLDDSLWLHGSRDITGYYIEATRGTGTNNVFAVGDFGEVLHYSGRTWKSFLPQTRIGTGAYYAIAIRGNLVIAVGEDSPRAVILMGTHLP